jgi:hypothetical protein
MYEKLIEGVENALKFQLTQIDEDSFESEYESTHWASICLIFIILNQSKT